MGIPKKVVNASSGRDSASEVGKDLRIAIDLGISSPTITWSTVKEAMAVTNEMAEMTSRPMSLNSRMAGNKPPRMGPTMLSTSGSPRKPRASEAMVMPSWQAERNGSRLVMMRRVAAARSGFSLVAISTWLGRTLTMANSAATKNAFNRRNPATPPR